MPWLPEKTDAGPGPTCSATGSRSVHAIRRWLKPCPSRPPTPVRWFWVRIFPRAHLRISVGIVSSVSLFILGARPDAQAIPQRSSTFGLQTYLDQDDGHEALQIGGSHCRVGLAARANR